MADILERLSEDMKAAMKEHDKFTLSVIRMLRSELKYAELAAGAPLSEQEITEVLARELKKRKDAAQEFAKAGRDKTAEDLHREQAIIQKYLPEPFTEQEVRDIIAAVIASAGAQKSDFGKVMAGVMAQVRGRYDGSLVSKLVKESLDK
ncbi:MAG: GatB/YqeY domain-containing protein [Bacillota bacterium]|jgi:uncharacterized protein YqeY